MVRDAREPHLRLEAACGARARARGAPGGLFRSAAASSAGPAFASNTTSGRARAHPTASRHRRQPRPSVPSRIGERARQRDQPSRVPPARLTRSRRAARASAPARATLGARPRRAGAEARGRARAARCAARVAPRLNAPRGRAARPPMREPVARGRPPHHAQPGELGARESTERVEGLGEPAVRHAAGGARAAACARARPSARANGGAPATRADSRSAGARAAEVVGRRATASSASARDASASRAAACARPRLDEHGLELAEERGRRRRRRARAKRELEAFELVLHREEFRRARFRFEVADARAEQMRLAAQPQRIVHRPWTTSRRAPAPRPRAARRARRARAR